MSERKIIRRPLQKVSIGNMRELIGLYTRDIKSPSFNSAKFTEKYTLFCDTWAMVITVFGSVDFAGTNLNSATSHKFFIRYVEGVNTELRIKWEDNYYEILEVTNIDTRKDILLLEAKQLGDTDLKSNQ